VLVRQDDVAPVDSDPPDRWTVEKIGKGKRAESKKASVLKSEDEHRDNDEYRDDDEYADEEQHDDGSTDAKSE
jgi:hypothetical protein